jgi:cyanophycin synthetase
VVEEFIAGREYRFLVINDKVEAVVERRTAQIAGDGTHTIEQLVELTNAARLKAIQHRYSRQPIVVNDYSLRILQREGLSLQSVPASGQRVQLHYDDSRLLGGDFVDSLDLVHPDNLRLARHAAAVVGLDIAGIDIILTDISRSIWETSGAVLEFNDRPGLQIFLYPTEGQPRDPGPAIVDMLFPPGKPVRVPIVAITKSAISTELAHAVALGMTEAGRSVGLAAADGLFVNTTYLRFADPSELAAARKILNHPAVDFAVIEADPAEILERGLCFDYCDVAVVMELSGLAPPGFPPPETVVCRLVASRGAVFLGDGLSRMAEMAPGLEARLRHLEIGAGETRQGRIETIAAEVAAAVIGA